MTKEQMKKLSEDKEFISELLVQETEENVKNLFKSRGVELTDEDIQDLKTLTMMCIKNKIELPEEILENTSGGVNIKKWFGQNWDKLIYVACALSFTGIAIRELIRTSNSVNIVLNNINEITINTSKQTIETLNNANKITDIIAHPVENIKKAAGNWFLNLFSK